MSLSKSENITQLFSSDIAWRYRIIPIELKSGILSLRIDKEHYKEDLPGELEFILGYNIELIQEDSDYINRELRRLYRKEKTRDEIEVTKSSDDFLFKIIAEAKNQGSSDIHIETYAHKCRIRLRIDGKLIERYTISKDTYPSFINKIKIKAQLDIAEKRLPQDGRILFMYNETRVDIRVSVLPSLHGEKVVLRLLNNDASHITLDNLGLDSTQLAQYRRVLKKPHGIILISGPTGSGKTTTLYATLKLLNNEQTNILTIEDPIEYTLDGVNQVQLKENIGLTFSSALKTFLRQDPDIIMLGEIRDGETAQMAIRAALTGHLVLSTIHTNSAWGTISRLTDMGVPAFLLANTLNASIAQRLVRMLCTHCKKEEIRIDNEMLTELGISAEQDIKYFSAMGCEHCFFTGYHGRMAIYEVIPVDEYLSQAIKESELIVDAYLKKQNINTLKEQAIQAFIAGKTSYDEIYPILLNN